MALNKENILIVDDDIHILELLQRHLQALNYHSYKAISVKEAIEILQDESIDLLITDLQMPGVDGLQLIKYASEHFPEVPRLVVTGYPSVDGALEVMKSGVIDYLTKPFTKDELRLSVLKSFNSRPKKVGKSIPKAIVHKNYGELIGESEVMQKVTDVIERVKDNRATVLISGESGTGKELVARAIHYMGKFSSAPFVAVNCGAIPENLLESELFGYAKGAFTGANEDRDGFFQAAHNGTLFLDEISNASMATQLRLLRVLQEKEVTRVGSQKVEKVEVRVIAATNVSLKELIKSGRFREDLYYRLTVVQIEIPPLRERLSDVPSLVGKFLSKYGMEYKENSIAITSKAMSVLERYSWPGNIRELENCMQRAIIMCDGQVEVKDLPQHLKYQIDFPNENDQMMSLKEVEKQHILKVLKAVHNNKTKAAEILQIDRKTLRDKIK